MTDMITFPDLPSPSGRTYTDVMVDIESIGLKFGQSILQVGLCFFDLEAPGTEELAVTRLTADPKAEGNDVWCQNTVAFWHTTAPELFETIKAQAIGGPTLIESLEDFNAQLKQYGIRRLWSDYPFFDVAHLKYAMGRHDIQPAWNHWQVDSSATIKHLCRWLMGSECEVPAHPGRVIHEAGSDAYQQALELKAWFNQVKGAMRPDALQSFMTRKPTSVSDMIC